MKQLLLVDDDAVVTRAYRDRLSAHGFRVTTAASGAGALSLLESAKPDLVVLDLMMPEVTGVDVLKFVRGQPRLAATPVVVLTNELQGDLGRHSARIGIQKAFRKDKCSPTALMAAIDEILDPRALAAARVSESVADPGTSPDEPQAEATATTGRDDMAQDGTEICVDLGDLSAALAREPLTRPEPQDQPNALAPNLCLRLMSSGNESEVEEVRRELLKDGMDSEKRRHPIAEALGVSGAEPRNAELKQASSLLQKGIEEMLVRESELASECDSLQGKVEDLTRTLAQAHADAAREIKSREAAERNQAEQLTGLLTTLERERLEWQQKLKSSDDSCKHAKEQAGSLSRLLQTQQAAATALKKELAALELQRDQQERALSDARKEMVAEREARVAAEERARLVEESLQKQWIERQELERQIQAHAASLGSLLTRVSSKALGRTGEP